MLYRIIGRKKTYQLIADKEYAAGENYKALLYTFPGVKPILDDEVRHGDLIKELANSQ